MTRILKAILCLLLCASAASATTTVTANLKSALGTAYQADSFVRFRLRGYSGSVPRVSGGVIVVTIPDVFPDSNGLVSTSLYNNYEIAPAGTYWTVEYWAGGNMVSTANYTICTITSGACSAGIGSYDLNSATANTVPPVVNPPTGDSTYLELTAGNGPLTNKLGILTGDQAKQVSLSAVSPQGLSVQEGTAASPTTGLYQTKPSLYLSRYDATDASACITGLTDGCLAAIFRIDGTNQSTTTSSTLTGVFVNLWGAKAANGASTYGNAFIGGAFQVWDTDGALNRVNLFGINPNVGAVFVPAGCWKGIVGDITCARTVLGAEIDVTNATATDGVFQQSIGNNFSGLTIGCFPTNATPKNCTTGFSLGTGTVDHGFWIGADLGSSVQTALLISQTSLNFKPEIAIHVASQGGYGMVIGTGSTTYTHSIANTFANPTIGLLLDASRLEGATGTAVSNNIQWRSANAATTYWNVRQFLGADGLFHWKEDDGAGGALADFMTWQPATALTVTGSVAATQALLFKAGPTNFFQINGTPTGGRIISVQDATQTLVGRNTTDTETNKTLTAPIITSPSITGIGSAGKAMCWKTASTLGFCSTVVDAAGACTCN